MAKEAGSHSIGKLLRSSNHGKMQKAVGKTATCPNDFISNEKLLGTKILCENLLLRLPSSHYNGCNLILF
jgi:hypothetical protein